MAARPNPSSLGAEFENSSPRCSPSVRNRCVGNTSFGRARITQG